MQKSDDKFSKENSIKPASNVHSLIPKIEKGKYQVEQGLVQNFKSITLIASGEREELSADDSDSTVIRENSMSVTREEIDAKLDANQARTEANLARFEERINSAINSVNAEGKRIEGAVSSLKGTVVVTAIASVLAIVGLNYQMLSNMIAAFDSGRDTSSVVLEAKQLREDAIETNLKTKELLDEVGITIQSLRQEPKPEKKE